MPKLSSGHWILIVLGIFIVLALVILSRSSVNLARPAPATAPAYKTPTSTLNAKPSTLPILADHIPEFAGITNWWNTNEQPLTVEKLKGKVVLIDFWTYSCINCIRTQPVLRAWWKAYEKDGLVIVGVHTPEFAFEKDPNNVNEAIKKAGLLFPIALDPDYKTWTAYANHYWPAEYFFDREGRLRHTHFGEGNYAESEAVIRELLAENGDVSATSTNVDTTPKFETIKTPETYFGYARAESYANYTELKRDQESTYTLRPLKDNEWTLGGRWLVDPEKAVSLAASNVFRMNVDANAMHLVLGSTDGQPKRVQIFVDGLPAPSEFTSDDVTYSVDERNSEFNTSFFTVSEKRLYRIAKFPKGGRHTVELRLLYPGIEFYAATFGE